MTHAIDRRRFAQGLVASAFAGLALHSRKVSAHMLAEDSRYGAVLADPAELLDLPPGFSYRILSQFGETMDDGYRVPNSADGMGCVALSDGRLCLMRNHELGPNAADEGPFGNEDACAHAFDRCRNAALPGGVSALILDPDTLALKAQYLALAGTIRNCSGGMTPWGSWLSCEEDVSRGGGKFEQDHGWVFEVPVASGGLVQAEPLRAMGRFNHEAAVCDPRSGAIYMTEDRHESLFYRFLPTEPGALRKGGRLQALAFASGLDDTRNWSQPTLAAGDWHAVRWIDLDEVESPRDDLRKRGARAGAAVFARGEGIHGGDGEIYFTCTSGGPARRGQIMRYRPSPAEGREGETAAPGRLQLFLESTDPEHFSFGDNLTVAPNGDLIVCEDRRGSRPDNWLRGVTPDGRVYPFARVAAQTKCAGVCFASDGKTLFLNLYSPARTIAIRGPF